MSNKPITEQWEVFAAGLPHPMDAEELRSIRGVFFAGAATAFGLVREALHVDPLAGLAIYREMHAELLAEIEVSMLERMAGE